MLDGLLGCEQSDVPFAAGIVEGNMQGAEGRDRLLDQGDDVLLPTDICLDEEGLSAGRGDLADNIFSFRNAAARDNDVCAVPEKASAVALPMPEVPPVMTTVLFSNVFMVGV